MRPPPISESESRCTSKDSLAVVEAWIVSIGPINVSCTRRDEKKMNREAENGVSGVTFSVFTSIVRYAVNST